MKRILKIKRCISLVLLFTISISLFSIYGCNNDETSVTPTQVQKTTTINGTVNTSEIGGSNLQVQSAFKQNSVINNGQYSTEVSKIGTQILFIIDANHELRGLTLSTINHQSNSPLVCDALSTAYALMLLAPGITSTLPDTTEARLSRMNQINSFNQFVIYLRNQLPNASLNYLISQSQTNDLLTNSILEFTGIDTIRKVDNQSDPDPYFQVNQNFNTITFKNFNWRFANLFRRDLKANGNENSVHNIFTPITGGVPYSWGCVFTQTCLSPTVKFDNDYANIDLETYESEYWLVGIGFKPSDPPPNSIDTNILVSIIGSVTMYIAIPIFDLLTGGSIFSNINEISNLLLNLSQDLSTKQDVISIANQIRNSANLTALARASVNLFFKVAGYLLGDAITMGMLVVNGILTSFQSQLLAGLLPSVGASLAASNCIIWSSLIFIDTPKYSRYKVQSTHPVLLSPINGSNNQSLTPILSCYVVMIGTANYNFQVSNSSDFSTLIVNEYSSSSQYQVPINRLNGDSQYFWRVSATINSQVSRWSSVWNFTTQTGGGSGGLVAYYPFNGNTNDESGNNNNGINNGATLTIDRFNNPNSAYNFDGVNNYILVSSNNGLQFGIADVTVCSWIKTTQTNPSGRIINRGECNGSSGWQLTYDNATNSIVVGLQHGGGATYFRGDRIVNDNLWHFLVWSRKSNFIKIYIDGAADGDSGSFTVSLTNLNSSLKIGKGDSPCTYPFRGTIDDIRIYNRALSDSEIQTLYHEGGW